MQNHEKLEKLKREQRITEQKLTVARHREQQLAHEMQRLTRSERTHRLCTRAGMLESFLQEPTILTDDDVMDLLKFTFDIPVVRQKLDELIRRRSDESANEEG